MRSSCLASSISRQFSPAMHWADARMVKTGLSEKELHEDGSGTTAAIPSFCTAVERIIGCKEGIREIVSMVVECIVITAILVPQTVYLLSSKLVLAPNSVLPAGLETCWRPVNEMLQRARFFIIPFLVALQYYSVQRRIDFVSL